MHPDVIVVGGGIIGLSIARRAAQDGWRVTVVDDARNGAASSVGAGMLAPVTEVHVGEEPLLRLNLESAAMYPTWVESLEADSDMTVGYRRCGTLVVARDSDDRASLLHLMRLQERLGLQVEALRSREVRQLEPAVAPTVRGGIFVDGDHQVDGPAVTGALRVACERAGVVIESGRAALVTRGGRAVGVELEGGDQVLSERVVVAAGCWSGALQGFPLGPLPVHPVKGQLVRLGARPTAPTLTRVIRGLDAYLVPRSDGRMVVGATVEESGEDLTPTAGATHALLQAACELVPGTVEMRFEGVHVGLRPATPDNAPVLGDAGIEGVVVASGHYRNGILLAPVTAELIVRGLVEGVMPEAAQPFSVDRFAGGAAA